MKKKSNDDEASDRTKITTHPTAAARTAAAPDKANKENSVKTADADAAIHARFDSPDLISGYPFIRTYATFFVE